MRADGGGAAHFGRLCGWALRRFCAARRLRFRGLHFSHSDGSVALDGYASFSGSKLRLILSAMGSHLASRRAAIFFDHPGPARMQGLIPRPLRAPHAIALLGIDAWRPFDAAGRRSVAAARSLVAISEETARRAAPFLPEESRVRVVHPGIEPLARGDLVDDELLARAGEGFLLVVARMAGPERLKGHDDLLAALAELPHDEKPVRLVIAGEGVDRPRIEALAIELGVADRTLFTGAVTGATLAELYRRASAFAMPSRLEGFGLVFVEAMAAGLPCVALANTAPAEIIVDGETGVLVRADDPQALAAALADLLFDSRTARKMGEAGRRRYEQLFTAECFEHRFEPVLDELVGT